MFYWKRKWKFTLSLYIISACCPDDDGKITGTIERQNPTISCKLLLFYTMFGLFYLRLDLASRYSMYVSIPVLCYCNRIIKFTKMQNEEKFRPREKKRESERRRAMSERFMAQYVNLSLVFWCNHQWCNRIAQIHLTIWVTRPDSIWP
jgi:hypothetical protein